MELQEEESNFKPSAKLSITGGSRGEPSILYIVDNIPSAEKLKFEVISHFQNRKRFKGGEVVEKEYQVVGPNSALLLFENAGGKSVCVSLAGQTAFFLFTLIRPPDPI